MTTDKEVRSKNTPAITNYAIGAAKDNKMKIFETITLNRYNTALRVAVCVGVLQRLKENFSSFQPDSVFLICSCLHFLSFTTWTQF